MSDKLKYTIFTVEMYEHLDGFRLDWTADIGFGVLLFTRSRHNGMTYVDSEEMSKEFIAAVLAKFLADVIDPRA